VRENSIYQGQGAAPTVLAEPAGHHGRPKGTPGLLDRVIPD
jgi:hypothetical protein